MGQSDFKFRLYVAGDSTNSAAAVGNLNTLCREHLPDRHKIEIVDVFLEPERALADGVFLTPTIVKLSPAPVRKIVGTLTQAAPFPQAVGIAADSRL
jgi:circadian clock protein KaiB